MSLVFSQLGTAGWEVGGGVKGVPFGLRACDVKPSSFLVEVVSGHAEFIPSVSRSGPMVREGGGGVVCHCVRRRSPVHLLAFGGFFFLSVDVLILAESFSKLLFYIYDFHNKLFFEPFLSKRCC